MTGPRSLPPMPILTYQCMSRVSRVNRVELEESTEEG
jgi:hypothetical protein